MEATDKAEAFYSFLDEYTAFFGEMERFEQQKLRAMLSGRLPELEHAIAVSQANAMQLENLERQRMRMQQEAGLGSMSMSELAASATGERGMQLERQLHRLSGSLQNIRFYNNKSMTVAQDRLHSHPEHTKGAYGAPATRPLLEAKA